MSDRSEPHVTILGAGPAGVGAAFQLRRLGRARVTVLEQRDSVGGNAGSFEADGQRLDYGSHRLHPACDPEILADIRELLGDDLLDRFRHGRIHLRGRWIHFPLKPVDLLLKLDPGFALGTARDMVRRTLPGRSSDGDTFASVLLQSLGPTICHDFYFPYARKIWGLAPEELSAVQARRRVSANSFLRLARKVLSQVPGFKRPGAGRFYYPRRGYGQISEAYARAATEAGANLCLGTRVTGLSAPGTDADPWVVTVETDEGERTLEADFVWSTLPLPLVARMTRPAPPAEVLDGLAQIQYRAMILVYLQLPVDRFTEYDAHYFPDSGIGITRLSEPKNYAAADEPKGSTTLCAELPCSPADEWWKMSDEQLGARVRTDLERAGIPVPVEPTAVFTRRLRRAYPIYARGYEEPFRALDRWAAGLPRLLTYGRQGLFAHDNTHHALYMAYSAADCLIDGRFDHERWAEYRRIFETHVVED